MDAVGNLHGTHRFGRSPVIGLASKSTLIDQPLQDLLDKEWVSVGLRKDLLPQVIGQVSNVEEAINEVTGLAFRERSKGDSECVLAPRGECGMVVSELGAGSRDQ